MDDKEEKKEMLKLPKEELFPYALLTGGIVLSSIGLLLTYKAGEERDIGLTFVLGFSGIATFILAGYYLHAYHRWLILKVKK